MAAAHDPRNPRDHYPSLNTPAQPTTNRPFADDVITPPEAMDQLDADAAAADLIVWAGLSFEQSASAGYFRDVRAALQAAGRLDSCTQAIVNPCDDCLFNLMSALATPGYLDVLDVREAADDALPALVDAILAARGGGVGVGGEGDGAGQEGAAAGEEGGPEDEEGAAAGGGGAGSPALPPTHPAHPPAAKAATSPSGQHDLTAAAGLAADLVAGKPA